MYFVCLCMCVSLAEKKDQTITLKKYLVFYKTFADDTSTKRYRQKQKSIKLQIFFERK